MAARAFCADIATKTCDECRARTDAKTLRNAIDKANEALRVGMTNEQVVGWAWGPPTTVDGKELGLERALKDTNIDVSAALHSVRAAWALKAQPIWSEACGEVAKTIEALAPQSMEGSAVLTLGSDVDYGKHIKRAQGRVMSLVHDTATRWPDRAAQIELARSIIALNAQWTMARGTDDDPPALAQLMRTTESAAAQLVNPQMPEYDD